MRRLFAFALLVTAVVVPAGTAAGQVALSAGCQELNSSAYDEVGTGLSHIVSGPFAADELVVVAVDFDYLNTGTSDPQLVELTVNDGTGWNNPYYSVNPPSDGALGHRFDGGETQVGWAWQEGESTDASVTVECSYDPPVTTTTVAPIPEGIAVTELCVDGVDVLRIENLLDYLAVTVLVDAVVVVDEAEWDQFAVTDVELPTGGAAYSTVWFDTDAAAGEYIDGPSGDLPICAQATTTTIAATTTIAEVETDVADSNSSGVAVLGMLAIGLLVLAGASVRARRQDR